VVCKNEMGVKKYLYKIKKNEMVVKFDLIGKNALTKEHKL
jgi:hypothetical protein